MLGTVLLTLAAGSVGPCAAPATAPLLGPRTGPVVGLVSAAGRRASSFAEEPDLARAFERAATEKKCLVLGVYTAGEGRSEDFAKRVLKDKAVKGALADAVFVPVLLGAPSKADAKRFGGLDVDTHRNLERAALDHLPKNAEGVLASPQHVWFAPDGRLLLAAPFELEPEELVWLDWRAQQLAGEADLPQPSGARAPRRYLLGEAFAPADGDRYGRGLLPAEMEVDLDLLRKRGQGGGGGGFGGGAGGGNPWSRDAIEAFGRLAFTDHPDAQKEIRNELGNVFLRLGPSTALLDAGLEVVAYAAPRSGVEAVVGFLGDPSPALRARAAAALEALGFGRDGWSDLRKALEKEDQPVARIAMLRAAGVVGRGEAQARRLLVREATKGATRADVCAALIGLGHFGDGEGTESLLIEKLGEAEPDLALAAAAAMALTRDTQRFVAPIQKRAQGVEAPEAALFQAAVEVLQGAPTAKLQGLLQRVAPDEFPRGRLFFTPRPAAPQRGPGGGGGAPGGGGGAPGGGGGAPGGGGGAPGGGGAVGDPR